MSCKFSILICRSKFKIGSIIDASFMHASINSVRSRKGHERMDELRACIHAKLQDTSGRSDFKALGKWNTMVY